MSQITNCGPNKYKGYCADCGSRVGAYSGVLAKVEFTDFDGQPRQEFRVYHGGCFEQVQIIQNSDDPGAAAMSRAACGDF